jgi:hypothetical protein
VSSPTRQTTANPEAVAAAEDFREALCYLKLARQRLRVAADRHPRRAARRHYRKLGEPLDSLILRFEIGD